jgi:cytochrome c-type biogenesis protein
LILDGSITFVAAFLGGIVSFLSPCVLPLLPVYVSVLSGNISEPEKWQAATGSIFFGLGFTAVFVILGLISSAIGQFLIYNKPVIYTVMGMLVIILGLHQTGVFRIGILYRERKFRTPKTKYPKIQAFLIGLAFAFGWTPCIGPILASILTLAMQSSAGRAAGLLAVYSAGMWLPFFILSFFADVVVKRLLLRPNILRCIEFSGGVLLILLGVMLITGSLSRISELVNLA